MRQNNVVVYNFVESDVTNKDEITANLLLKSKKLRLKRKIPLFPKMRVTKQIFTWVAANLFILINYIDLFNFLNKL